MNINASIVARVTERFAETKKPCSNFATEAAAEKATAIAAKSCGECFSAHGKGESARYIVVFVPAMQRWVGAIDFTELLRRPNATGGYLGVEPGFFKF